MVVLISEMFLFALSMKITPLKLFVAPESFWFSNLLPALGGLQNHCSQNTHVNTAAASVTNLSRFYLQWLLQLHGTGAAAITVHNGVCLSLYINAPACHFCADSLSKIMNAAIFIVTYLFISLWKCWIFFSFLFLGGLPSETRPAQWICLCIAVPSFKLPDAE